jgi:hypothetical protein
VIEYILVVQLAVAIIKNGSEITEMEMGPFKTFEQCATIAKTGVMIHAMMPGAQIKNVECKPQAAI